MEYVYTLGIFISLVFTFVAYGLKMVKIRENNCIFGHTTWGKQYVETEKEANFQELMRNIAICLVWPATFIVIGHEGLKKIFDGNTTSK